MKIKANIGFFITIVSALLTFLLFSNLRSLPIIITLIFCYLDIWLYKIFFEYQRITLILARIFSLEDSDLSVVQIQMILANDTLSLLLLFSSFFTGLIWGILLQKSLILFLIYLILKHFLNTLIPAYIPYTLWFKLVENEANKVDRNGTIYLQKIRIQKYLEEMPHNKNYENWAFKKYGNNLLKVKTQ
jgi:hypothetical protein